MPILDVGDVCKASDGILRLNRPLGKYVHLLGTNVDALVLPWRCVPPALLFALNGTEDGR
jgi:hypothetical protein